MNQNFYNEMKTLINNIDLNKLNLSLIKKNTNTLFKIYDKLKIIWNEINSYKFEYIILNENDDKYKYILNLLNDNFLSNNKHIKNIILNSTYIHYLSYSNIHFYWLSNLNNKTLNDENYLLSLYMFKISLCLNLFKFNNTDDIQRYIIWIPIDKKRNFKYDTISLTNLKKTSNEFEAFVASGVTFGTDERITIITRYEEVEKLLIHELIHNYFIDGSKYHDELNDVLNEYKITKNNTKSKNKNFHYIYSIYESYTELLSTYFYLLFSNIKINKKLDENNLLGQILLELLYSYNIIANLIKLNGYSNYNEFKNILFFKGDICKYEYYYVKALMYNNFILKIGNNLNDFINIYTNIINMIKKNQINDDLLMKDIYDNYVKHDNFKYQIH